MKIKKALVSLSLMALFAGLLVVSCGSSPKAVLTEGLKVEGTATEDHFKGLASDKTVSVIIELSDDEVKDGEDKDAIGWIKAKVGDATAAAALDENSGFSVTAKPFKSKPTDANAKYDRITLEFQAGTLVKLVDDDPTITIPASVLKSGKDLTVTTTGNKKLTFAITARQQEQGN